MSVKAVMKALNIMKIRKAAGPSGVTTNLLKVSRIKLAEVANDLLPGKGMSESWRRNHLIKSIPIYKWKGDKKIMWK